MFFKWQLPSVEMCSCCSCNVFRRKIWPILPKTSEIILPCFYFPTKIELTQPCPQSFSFAVSFYSLCAIYAFFRFRQTLAGYKEFIAGGGFELIGKGEIMKNNILACFNIWTLETGAHTCRLLVESGCVFALRQRIIRIPGNIALDKYS